MTTTLHTDSPVQIAADARKAIRAAFPGVKFSLSGSRGTGYGWLHLKWTDGPTDRQMRETVEPFNARLGNHHHINSSRSYSAEAETWAASQLEIHQGRWASDIDFGDSTYYAQQACLSEHDFSH